MPLFEPDIWASRQRRRQGGSLMIHDGRATTGTTRATQTTGGREGNPLVRKAVES